MAEKEIMCTKQPLSVTSYFSELYGGSLKYYLYHFKGLEYFTIRGLYKLIKTLESSEI